MAESAPASGPATTSHAPTGEDRIDWVAAERSPEFQELTRRRRSFTVPVLAFVFIWYFGFVALAGYAPDFMGERLVEGVTVGYVLALTQFIMTWVLGWLYLRQADRVFDPLARKAAARAVEAGEGRQRTAAEPPARPQSEPPAQPPTDGPTDGGERR